MSADALLERLDAKSTGAGRWIARCPAHEDRRPSLAIRELEDGTVLIRCFAGCGAIEIVRAVGLELDALFPARPDGHSRRPERRPIPAADVLLCCAEELLIGAVAAERVARGEALDERSRERLALAASRLAAACDAAGIRHG